MENKFNIYIKRFALDQVVPEWCILIAFSTLAFLNIYRGNFEYFQFWLFYMDKKEMYFCSKQKK